MGRIFLQAAARTACATKDWGAKLHHKLGWCLATTGFYLHRLCRKLYGRLAFAATPPLLARRTELQGGLVAPTPYLTTLALVFRGTARLSEATWNLVYHAAYPGLGAGVG